MVDHDGLLALMKTSYHGWSETKFIDYLDPFNTEILQETLSHF